MDWQRENLPRIKLDRPWKRLLLPGLAIQWLMYMFPSGRYGSILSETRQARSPLMTYVYSAVFYIGLLALLSGAFTPKA